MKVNISGQLVMKNGVQAYIKPTDTPGNYGVTFGPMNPLNVAA